MQEDLQAELIRTVPQLKTPNILIVGRTGVGAWSPADIGFDPPC